MAVSQEQGVWLARNESDLNWSNVGPTICPLPLTCLLPWPCIFKVKFSYCCTSGRGCLLGMKWKGYELIRFWTHNMTLTFDPTHDFDLGFFRSNLEIAVFQEWMGPALYEHLRRCIRKCIKAVNGDMEKNKSMGVVIPDYCVVSPQHNEAEIK